MSQNIRQIMRHKLKDWNQKELKQLMKALISSQKKARGARKKKR